MKLTFLQVDKKRELSELLQHLTYDYNMTISVIISVGKDVIWVYNDENVKLLRKDLIDIFLKAC